MATSERVHGGTVEDLDSDTALWLLPDVDRDTRPVAVKATWLVLEEAEQASALVAGCGAPTAHMRSSGIVPSR